MAKGRLLVLAPAAFVLLWSTGFVFAREGVRYADPLTLVTLRFAVAAVAMLAIAAALGAGSRRRARRPTRREIAHSAVVGVLLQTVYVGGVFAAIDHHLAAGVTALIVGLQPVLSACIVGPLLDERVVPLQWAGLLLGLGGVALVVERKVHLDPSTTAAIGFSLAALVGITAGTLYQRRFNTTIDLRAGMAVQYGAGALGSLVLALGFERLHVEWTWQLIGSLLYMSLVLSTAAILGLMWLIRNREVTRVASLFYLVPPVAALLAWPWFGETVTAGMAAGMALAGVGVALVQRGAR